jgi:hypothetical protein
MIASPVHPWSSIMNDIIATMTAVAGLVTRGSDLARAEAQHLAAERERRTDDAYQSPNWVVLLPVAVACTGGPEQPVERLMTLQSAIAKAVHLVTLLAQLRFGVFPNRRTPKVHPELSHS